VIKHFDKCAFFGLSGTYQITFKARTWSTEWIRLLGDIYCRNSVFISGTVNDIKVRI